MIGPAPASPSYSLSIAHGKVGILASWREAINSWRRWCAWRSREASSGISWRAETKATGVMWTHGELECITIPAILSPDFTSIPLTQWFCQSWLTLPALETLNCLHTLFEAIVRPDMADSQNEFMYACMYMPSCQKCGNRSPSKHIVWIWKLSSNFFVTLGGCRAQHCSLAVAVTAHLRSTWILNFDISWHLHALTCAAFRHGKAVGRLIVSTCSASAFSGS